MSQTIKLLVGLANPGPEYARTRHNAGAWAVEELARVHNVTLKNEAKFQISLNANYRSLGDNFNLSAQPDEIQLGSRGQVRGTETCKLRAVCVD